MYCIALSGTALYVPTSNRLTRWHWTTSWESAVVGSFDDWIGGLAASDEYLYVFTVGGNVYRARRPV